MYYFSLFLKGLAMGAANVIPGVSGGTIAFITGIYEKLINSIKSFDLDAFKLLLGGKFKEFAGHTSLGFLAAIFLGIGVSIVSLAKLLEFLFCNYEILTNAFFFGLILASVYLVGKEIRKWGGLTILSLLIGAAIAVSIVFFNPANANENMFYLFLCGMVAISSMILPGLSGSYILLIMGNYLLVIAAIGDFFEGDMATLKILIPFAIGCGIGLLVFARFLAYVFEKAHDATVGLLTGFVAGSLVIIWPWKITTFMVNELGETVDKKGTVIIDTCREGVVLDWQRYLPDPDQQLLFALLLTLFGILIVIGIERLGTAKPEKS